MDQSADSAAELNSAQRALLIRGLNGTGSRQYAMGSSLNMEGQSSAG